MTESANNHNPSLGDDGKKTVQLASPVVSNMPRPQNPVVWSTHGTKPMSFGAIATTVLAKGTPLKPTPRASAEDTQLTARAEVRLPKKRVGRPPIIETEAAKTITRSGKLALMAQQAQTELTKTAIIVHKPETLGILELLEKAASCLESGDLAMAESLLTVAIAKGVYDAKKERTWELTIELGTAFYLGGLYSDARKAYRQSCILFPERLISQFNLGTATLMLGEFPEALACFQQANAIEAGEPKVLCNMGAAYFLQDEHALAEPLLREALRLRPDYLRALNTLSSVLGAMNQLNESLEVCDQVLELSEGHPEASFKKGVIHLSRGQLEEAVTFLEAATASPLLHSDSKCFLALAFVAGSQPLEAENILRIDEYDQNLNRELLANSWKAIGTCWRDSEDTERALLAFRVACDLVHNDAPAWLEMGKLYEKLSESEFAQTCFQTYAELQAQSLNNPANTAAA